MRICLAVALSGSFVIAQTGSAARNQTIEDPQEARQSKALAARIQLARTAAPEFHSDLLLHLADPVNGSMSKRQRIDLLQEAFETARNAQEAMPIRQLLGGSDSLSGSVRRVLARGIDRVSLQSRAVVAMAANDPPRASKLSEEIVIVPSAKRPCSDWFEYDFAKFYRMQGSVGRGGMAADGLKHVTQVAPLLDLLSTLPIDERAERAGQVALWIQNSTPDWHGLLASLDALGAVLPRFANGLPQSHRIALAEALRRSFADHLAADWCDGFTSREKASDPRIEPPDQLIAFFARIVSPFGGPGIAPLQRKMVKGRAIAGRSSDRLWQSPSSAKLHREYVGLFLKTDSISKQSPEWRTRSNELFDALRSWRGADSEDKVQYFLEKSTLYRNFVTSPTSLQPFTGRTQEEARQYFEERKTIPDLPERRRALEELMLWLDGPAGTHAYDQRRIYLFGQLDALLTAAEQAGLDKETVLSRLRAAKHPLLGAYGAVLSTAASRP